LIESIELRNIKSYAEPAVRVLFRPGVNLIWGENGSGKTTILEAIGCTLFGALDYNLAQFVREGVNDGDIVLKFEGNDERSYQVVRGMKSTGKLEVYDCETGRRLVSKRQDAEDWLTDHLGVKFGGYGKRLFENALGVAQGKMTGSFLETDATRKTIFDPILRVDEYNTAWTKLAKVSSELSARLKNVGEQIARLEGRLEKLPEQEAQLASLKAQIDKSELSLGIQNANLTEQKNAISIFDACKSDIDEAERKLKDARHQRDLLAGQLANAEVTWQEAENAAQILQACQLGYDVYVQASARKEELLVQQNAYNQGRQHLLEIERDLGKVKASLSSLVEQLRGVTIAEVRIQELEPLVQRQLQLEEAVEHDKEQVANYQEALKRITSADQAIPGLRQRLESVRRDLGRRTEIESQLAGQQELLEALQATIGKLTTDEEIQLNESKALENKLQTARGDVLKFEEAGRNLKRLEQEQADAQEQLKQVEKQIQERAGLDQEIQRLDDEIRKQQSFLSNAQADEQQCHQRTAEFIERLNMLQSAETAECPVCKRPLEAHAAHDIEVEFQVEISAWKTKESAALQADQDANREISALLKQENAFKKHRDKLPAVQRAEEIQGEINEKRQQLEQYEHSMLILAETQHQVTELVAKQLELDEQTSTLRQSLRAKRVEVGQVQSLSRQLNIELASLAQPAQAVDMENQITSFEKDIAHWQVIADGLADAPFHLEATRAALAELNDPRAEQTRLKGIAGQRLGIEVEHQRQEQTKVIFENRYKDQAQTLQIFAGLEQALAETNDRIEKNKKTYQDYLTNQNMAAARSQRLKQFETYREQHANQVALCTELDAQWQAAQTRYDAKQHILLRSEIEQLSREIAQLEAQLGEWHRYHLEFESEVLLLRQQQAALRISLQQKARLEHIAEVFKFMREGIRLAGPQVVRQRVKSISYSADRIFQDIIDDPMLTLKWDESYAIKVFCRREERIFNQLSGGEQMAAAIAVRLALMIQMSDLRILFLDEPTANMDDTRRDKLADRITRLEGLKQIFVITHDDAFRRDTHNFIQVSKQDGVSTVQAGG